MRVVPHDLHVQYVSKEIASAGAVGERDRQVVESKILPCARFRGNGSRRCDQRRCAVEVVDVADKVVGEDFLAVGSSECQAMPDGHLRRKRLMKSFMYDLAARKRCLVARSVELKGDVDWFRCTSNCHRICPTNRAVRRRASHIDFPGKRT